MTNVTARVDVNGNQGFSLIDDQRSTTSQRYTPRQASLDLFLDLVLVEQVFFPFVHANEFLIIAHAHVVEERGDLLAEERRINNDLFHIRP